MKIAIAAGFSAERNMNVNTCHTVLCNCAAKLVQCLLYFIVIPIVVVLKTQAQVHVSFIVEKKSDSKIISDTVVETKEVAYQYIRGVPNRLRMKGFIYASPDSTYETNDTVVAMLYAGKRFAWKNFLFADAAPEIVKATKDFFAAGNNDAVELLTAVSNFYENRGYAFPQIRIDSIVVSEDYVSGKISVQKGSLVKIDSIRTPGTKMLNRKFLHQYIFGNSDRVYRKDLPANADAKLDKLSFIERTQPSKVQFYQTGAVLDVFVRKRKTDVVNFIVGLMQNENQKSRLTGEAQLILNNSFGNAENIQFNWQQLLPKSPRLNFSFEQPYIGNSNIGLRLKFDLFKKDSAFVNVAAEGGVTFTKEDQSFSLYIKQFTGNISSIDTIVIKQRKSLPAYADLSFSNIGFGYKFDTRNSSFNSTSGQNIVFESEFGIKKIKKNLTVSSLKENNFNYETLYDSVKLRSYNIRLNFSAEKYFQISSYSVFKTGLDAAVIFSDNYFSNELYRIGGIRFLRGFDEQSIFTNRYLISNAEYRLLLNSESFFRIFTDFGFAKTEKTFNYLSFGTGLSLRSKAGLLNVLYAIGKRSNESFNFRKAKIHIGFTALF